MACENSDCKNPRGIPQLKGRAFKAFIVIKMYRTLQK